MNRLTRTLTTKATAADSRGTFEGTITFNPSEGDSDGERIANFTNLPGTFPLDFAHLIRHDPAAVVGQASAVPNGDGRSMTVLGRLTLGKGMADEVHRRMQLPADAQDVLSEMSVMYDFDPTLVTTDPNGVRAIHDANLLAISVVHAGAQATAITAVKERSDEGWKAELDDYSRILDALAFDTRADADLVAALDALDPPAPTPEDRQKALDAQIAHAEHEMFRRGMDDPRWTDAYSPEDMVGPVTPDEVERDRARTDSRYRVQSDGPVPFEAVDLIDAEREDERVHRDDELKRQADFAREQMNVEREIAERARWEDAYGPDDLMRPAAAPEPDEPTTIRLSIPS